MGWGGCRGLKTSPLVPFIFFWYERQGRRVGVGFNNCPWLPVLTTALNSKVLSPAQQSGREGSVGVRDQTRVWD